MVQTVKKLLAKSKDEDPHIALLYYRASPFLNLPSPAELLMGRKIRTKLPSLKQQFKTNNTDHVRTQMQQNQDQHRKYHGGYDLKPLQPGDDVFMRNQADTHWTPAKVIERTPEPKIMHRSARDSALPKKQTSNTEAQQQKLQTPSLCHRNRPI